MHVYCLLCTVNLHVYVHAMLYIIPHAVYYTTRTCMFMYNVIHVHVHVPVVEGRYRPGIGSG